MRRTGVRNVTVRMAQRGRVLALYRGLLGASRAHPSPAAAAAEVREAFRAARRADPNMAAELARAGESRLALLRMTLPRHALPLRVRGEARAERLRRDARGGLEEVEGRGSAVGHAHRNGHYVVTEDQVRRHRALDERMHFRGPFWEGRR